MDQSIEIVRTNSYQIIGWLSFFVVLFGFAGAIALAAFNDDDDDVF